MGTDGDAALFLWESVALKASQKAINTLPVTCRRLKQLKIKTKQKRTILNTKISDKFQRIDKKY